MSYRTKALAARLGYTCKWSTNTVYTKKQDLLVDFRIKNYILSLMKNTIKFSPKNKNTKSEKKLGFIPKYHPVIVGDVVIKKTNFNYNIIIHYFLSEEGVPLALQRKYALRLLKGKTFLQKLYNCKINYIFYNYYDPILAINILHHKNSKIRRKANYILSNTFSPIHEYNTIIAKQYDLLREQIIIAETKFKRYKVNNYFDRVFYPLFILFFYDKFDVTLVARLIAMELENLRKFHAIFLKFVKEILTHCFEHFGYKRLNGIQIKVRGRVTSFRRQIRRKQKKYINIRLIKRSHLNTQSTHFFETSYNRYGSIGIEVAVEEKKKDFMTKSNSWVFFNKEHLNLLTNNLILKNKIWYNNNKTKYLTDKYRINRFIKKNINFEFFRRGKEKIFRMPYIVKYQTNKNLLILKNQLNYLLKKNNDLIILNFWKKKNKIKNSLTNKNIMKIPFQKLFIKNWLFNWFNKFFKKKFLQKFFFGRELKKDKYSTYQNNSVFNIFWEKQKEKFNRLFFFWIKI